MLGNKKHLKNPVVHTWNDLIEYNRALVQAYTDIVRMPDVSNIAFRFLGCDGHAKTEEEKASSAEAILETCRCGPNHKIEYGSWFQIVFEPKLG